MAHAAEANDAVAAYAGGGGDGVVVEESRRVSSVDILAAVGVVVFLLFMMVVSILIVTSPWSVFKVMAKSARLSYSLFGLTFPTNPRFPDTEFAFLDDPADGSPEAQRLWARQEPALRVIGALMVLMGVTLLIVFVVMLGRSL